MRLFSRGLLVILVALASSIAPSTEAQTTTPTPPEIWQCETVVHPVVEFHRARLVLRSDATFELHHTHTSPENGWSNWITGSWTRSATEVVLTPVTALRRAWIGDMHRQDHGEDVGAAQWEEPVSTAPWRLPVSTTSHGATLRSSELGTRVYRAPDGASPPPCDGDRPPLRRR